MRLTTVGLLILCAMHAAAHPPWESTSLRSSPEPALPARAMPIFEDLVIDQPIGLIDLPDRPLRLVLETRGKLKVIDSTIDNPKEADLILDLNHYGEPVAAVRDMTLDPQFETNGFVYLVWGVSPMLMEGGTRVSRFTIPKTSPPVIDKASRLDLITYPSGDHVGASLRFGPDGYLYIGTGDGSGPNPPDEYRTAQNLSDLRGSVLRIDVRGATTEKPYKIPSDNPFVSDPPARPEIFSYGVRNAFRIEFDPANERLWVADVGWVRSEMLHNSYGGANHGWSLYEGPHRLNQDQTPGPGPVVPPVLALPRAEAQSITGGLFQHSDAELFPGHYLFGDYVNGSVWAADLSDLDNVTYRKIADTGAKVVSFARIRMSNDELEATVVIDHRGRFLALTKADDDQVISDMPPFPDRLSETGLFSNTRTMTLAAGTISYRPVATMWRDGATTERFVAVPTSKPIVVSGNRRRYEYPPGTVFANTIFHRVIDEAQNPIETKIETQLLVFDGFNWHPYTFRWNDDQSDAVLVPKFGDKRELRVFDSIHQSRTMSYEFLSRDQCKSCHHAFHPGAMAFSPISLTGRSGATDWLLLEQEGWVTGETGKKRKHVDPYDLSQPLESRARSYLDMNCASCHAPAGSGLSQLNLMFETDLSKTYSIDQLPIQGTFDLESPKVIFPGRPERSVLMYRMATSGIGRMPHVGSSLPDQAATQMIWQWIETLADKDETKPRVSVPDDSTTIAMMNWRKLSSLPCAEAKMQVAQRSTRLCSIFEQGLLGLWIEPSLLSKSANDIVDVEVVERIAGDAKKGASWYADTTGAQCRSCHQKDLSGVSFGPSLEGLGKIRSRTEVIRSLLHPSELVDEKYRTSTFLLLDGSVVTGMVIRKDDAVTVVKTTAGLLTEVVNDDIEMVRKNSQSIMPEGLMKAMTVQQVADLVDYLIE